MDDGELDFSNQVLKMDHQLLTMDSFLEDFLGHSHAIGTQTHASNPTEQDAPLSQSYFHHRTKNHPVEEKTTTEETGDSAEIKSKKRAPGNRESGQGALEQEVARFKLLLVDIRGRIKGELGSFPYQKPTAKGIAGGILRNMLHSTLSGAYDVNQCDLEYPGLDNQDVGVSGGFQNEGYNEFLDFGQTNVRVTTNVNNPSTASKRRKGKVSNKRSNR
ncbi:hypothetical protein C5167_025145 [Papaver somniferum]|uniref:Uncharacterized protein n=1 Tax=Papaver somniferum TaxID=3469 RepID=A0A4Y7JTX8_PAPSO|nr:hypothetical protein C5167_025145 [Papaver somniferum]